MEQELLREKDARAVAESETAKAKKETEAAKADLEKVRMAEIDHSKQSQALRDENASLKVQIQSRDAQLSTLNSKLEATEKDVDRRAGLKSAETLRKLGVKPVKEAGEDGTLGKDDLWAQYGQIQDATAKREFYLAHKDRM